MKNQRGEVLTTTLVAVVAVFVVGLLFPKLNPFSNAADPANRRTASEISGRDIVDITKAAASSPEPISVHIDRSVDAKSEVTDPKLTLGQRIGRFFSGLATWGVILIAVLLALGIITPAGFILWSRHTIKSAFSNTIQAIRETDDETYQKLKPSLDKNHDKRDKKIVDHIKAKLH